MAPSAAAYYLDYRFVSAAVDRGVNAVRRLQVAGAMVDIWTLDPTTPEIETVLPAMIATGADQITTNDPVGLTTLWRRLSWAASS
jgi:glycerophosphoryl diester phosphodiesterase